MWFDTKKTDETPDAVVYEYGFETHDLSGKFALSKNDNSVTLLQKDKNYTDKVFSWIAGHVKAAFAAEGYPNKKMIATG
jgi:hypothetical protein